MRILFIIFILIGCSDNLRYDYNYSQQSDADSSVDPQDPNSDGSTNSGNGSSQPTKVPTIFDITTTTSNGYYKKDDKIDITIEFDKEVIVNGNSPSISFVSKGTDTLNGSAIYISGSNSKKLNFEYTVLEDDNAIDIDISKINLNLGTIKSRDNKDADLSIIAGSFSSKYDISIDNVDTAIIQFDEFNEKDVSSELNPTLRISGNKLTGFLYKIVNDKKDCINGNFYTKVDALSESILLTGLSKV